MKTMIAQGAEAIIYKENDLIIKERIPKSYRIKEIDEKIRRQRTRREINILKKASEIILVPKLEKNSSEKDYKIYMEFIEGKRLSEQLDKLEESKRLEICKNIGKQLALLHDKDIIHGDLTTSNLILKGNMLYFIDFGLSFIDQKEEHKAVDLHLIRQALESKHYLHYESCFNAVLKGYKETSKNFKEIMKRLEKVESRGRYKQKAKKQ